MDPYMPFYHDTLHTFLRTSSNWLHLASQRTVCHCIEARCALSSPDPAFVQTAPFRIGNWHQVSILMKEGWGGRHREGTNRVVCRYGQFSSKRSTPWPSWPGEYCCKSILRELKSPMLPLYRIHTAPVLHLYYTYILCLYAVP